MKAYIKENFKVILAITIMIFAVCALIVSNEIRAQMLPIASEELNVVYCEIDKEFCDYTGKPVENDIHRIIFADKSGNRFVMYKNDFKIVKYIDNIEVGQVNVEVSLDGYQETILIEDAFTIRPKKSPKPQITNATQTFTDLMLEEVFGADGYLLCKSKDNGKIYMPIKDFKSGKALVYTDTDIAPNEVYLYRVMTYKQVDGGFVLGEPSEAIKIYTPLDDPQITDVKNASHNTLRVEWAIVDGADGYQVYRSDKIDGEYTLLAEISDGMTMSYSDSSCECGKTYFYYIKACQKTDTESFYGDASVVVSGRTTPNKTYLSGVTTDNRTKVSLNWKKVSGAQGYEVYKNGQVLKIIDNADTVSFEETGMPKEAEASYKVRAYLVVNGKKIYGSFSGNYEKEYTITYSYGNTNDAMTVLTQYVGRPYKYGGTSSTKGWDCSSFVQYVLKKHFGVSLPRTASQQVGAGTSVSKNNRTEWKPGDLLFYKEAGKVSHVAIYLGNGQMIHALNSKYDTLIQDVDYYEKWDTKTSLYCVKRVLN